MNINTSSTYTYGSSSSKGMSGLASGLDTESLVKEMLSGTQSKIDAQEALKTQTEWKQEIYRDLIGSINDLQDKYFSSTSAGSLTNSAFYNTMSAVSSSKNFKVTASSTAPTGNVSLEVHQLASSYQLSSAQPVSGRLAGSFDAAALQTLLDDQRKADRTIAFNIGNSKGTTEVKVDLNRFFKAEDGSLIQKPDANGIANAIQSAIRGQTGLDVKVTISSGQFSIVSKDGERSLSVSSSSTKEALSALGLTAGTEARANVGKTQRTLSGKVSLSPGLNFAVSLDDGLQKTVSLDVTSMIDENGKLVTSKVRDTLADALDQQFGKGAIQVTQEAGNSLSISTPVAGRKLVVYAGKDKETLAALGLRNGQSNRISLYDTLEQMPAATELQGDEFEFEINGVQFSFSKDDDIDRVMRQINASEAGVTLTYKPLDDAFVLISNNSGAGHEIQLSQSKGNLLNVLLGGGADGNLTSGNIAVSAPWISGGKLQASSEDGYIGADGVKKGTFSLTVNDKDYTLTVAAKADGTAYTRQELVDELNSQLQKTFGTTPNESLVDVQAIELVADGSGRLSFAVRNGASVSMAATKASNLEDEAALKKLAEEGNLAVALGFVSKNEMNNLVSGSTKLSDAGLGDWAQSVLGIDKDTTFEGLAAAVDASSTAQALGVKLAFTDGKLVVTAEKPLNNFQIGSEAQTKELFGTAGLTLGVPSGQPAALVSKGQNAVVRIDGSLTERSSNVFSYNGLTVELTGVSAPAGTAMKGRLVLADGSEWKSINGRWVDADGYERAEDGQYVAVNASGDGKRVSSPDNVPAGYTIKRYPSPTFYAADGTQMHNVGINKDGELVDASGQPMQARESESISVTRDTDKIVDGVKTFIDEYNKLVKTINDLLNEDATYREYAPLTEEQRKEMSEKQIELWEEKAKEGLLRRDSILDGFLRDMRSVWYETNSSGYAIYQLGIETGDWSTRGQLTLGQNGEATLRQMLANDPTGVMNFFANSVDGAATRVNEIIKLVANTSSGSPGSLVELAGIKGKTSEKNNTLYNQIKRIDEKIERLKDQYEQEKDRYWKQFNAMEQQIQNMNSQSAWLAQQFSY